MKNKRLTVVLPCAGNAKRLGVPFSKEIFPIDQNQSLIDLTIGLFKGCTRTQVSFVVIITENKLDVVRYLSKYKSYFDITFTFFNPDYYEFPGSIQSAKHLFGDHNLILFPDSLLTLKNGESLYDLAINKFDEHASFLLCKETSDQDYMKKKGCVLINERQQIIDYEDKPLAVEGFNAVWCGLGFSLVEADSIIHFIKSGTLKLPGYKECFFNSKIYKSNPIVVNDYIDLGTWEDLKFFFGVI